MYVHCVRFAHGFWSLGGAIIPYSVTTVYCVSLNNALSKLLFKLMQYLHNTIANPQSGLTVITVLRAIK